jgi:hypothetical protein
LVLQVIRELRVEQEQPPELRAHKAVVLDPKDRQVLKVLKGLQVLVVLKLLVLKVLQEHRVLRVLKLDSEVSVRKET